MRTWDESIYAVNSYEMIQNGNYMVPYINGKIDAINDKPPLFFWHQIVSFKLFGYNEFAARFPSALYGAFSVLMLFGFLLKRFGVWLALCSALVLCTSLGFVTFHSSRTGDMDSMLAFGVLGMCIYLYKFNEEKNYKYYLLFAAFVLFAFLTKTLGALILMPVLIAFLLKKNFSVFKDLKFWIINAGLLASLGLFLYLRNGYEDKYFTSHFLGYFSRYKTMYNKDHDQAFDFYFNNLFIIRYSTYSLLVIPSLILVWRETNRALRSLVIFMLSAAVFFILVLSLSSSKCYWYDVPLYPLLAIPVGYFSWKACMFIANTPRSVAMFVLCFFIVPVYYAAKRSLNNDIGDVNARRCEVIPEYFHEHKSKMPYSKISVADNNYNSPVLFYKYHYKQYNQEITITSADLLKPQEIVIAGNDSIKKYITEHYQTEQLETFKNATIYKIK